LLNHNHKFMHKDAIPIELYTAISKVVFGDKLILYKNACQPSQPEITDH
jgi:hypothetical protein